MFFNEAGPTSEAAINSYIGSYASPEAAQADTQENAPQGYDYLKSEYGRLTGDFTADPFQDAIKSRTDALTQAALGGASLATGDVRVGGRLLSLPQTPVTSNTTGAPPVDPSLSVGGNRQVDNSLMTTMLQQQGAQYQLNRKENQIPDINAPDFSPSNYLNVVQRRANLAGVGPEFALLMKNNPDAIAGPAGDPRFSIDPNTKKIISSDELHPLAYDPGFIQMTKNQPDKANALFYALTGEDYKTAVGSKIESLVEQRAQRQKILEGIKGISADPITGAQFKTIETKDPLTNAVVQQQLPLTDLEKAALAKEGGTERLFGVQLPGLGGLERPKGMTDDEYTSYVNTAQQLRAKNPNAPVSQVANAALKMLYTAQQGRMAPPAKSGGIASAALPLSRFWTGNINNVSSLLNDVMQPALGGARPLPMIPDPKDIASTLSRDIPAPSDIYAQGVKYWEQGQ